MSGGGARLAIEETSRRNTNIPLTPDVSFFPFSFKLINKTNIKHSEKFKREEMIQHE